MIGHCAHVKECVNIVIILGIGDHHDSISWLHQSEEFSTKGKTLVLWIHTHVRGSLCGFSSVDVHTQYAYRLMSSNILGLVIELNNSGECGEFDFFELTNDGNGIVRNCGRTKNISSIQHESCARKELYKSAKDRITISDNISTKVQDFRFEEINLSLKEEHDWTHCKNCKKDFKNILLHLSRMQKCRRTYGKEYDKMKEVKAEEKKKYGKDYYHKNVDSIKKRKLNFANSNRESINAKKRKCDNDHREQRIVKHKIYNSTHRKVYILRANVKFHYSHY